MTDVLAALSLIVGVLALIVGLFAAYWAVHTWRRTESLNRDRIRVEAKAACDRLVSRWRYSRVSTMEPHMDENLPEVKNSVKVWRDLAAHETPTINGACASGKSIPVYRVEEAIRAVNHFDELIQPWAELWTPDKVALNREFDGWLQGYYEALPEMQARMAATIDYLEAVTDGDLTTPVQSPPAPLAIAGQPSLR